MYMSYGQHLVPGEGTSLSRVGPYRFLQRWQPHDPLNTTLVIPSFVRYSYKYMYIYICNTYHVCVYIYKYCSISKVMHMIYSSVLLCRESLIIIVAFHSWLSTATEQIPKAYWVCEGVWLPKREQLVENRCSNSPKKWHPQTSLENTCTLQVCDLHIVSYVPYHLILHHARCCIYKYFVIHEPNIHFHLDKLKHLQRDFVHEVTIHNCIAQNQTHLV